MPRGLRAVLRWRRERRKAGVTSAHVSHVVSASEIVLPRGTPSVLSATWIGHASTLLQVGTLNVLTDPMWSHRASPVSWAGPARLVVPAVPLRALPPIDVVLISHNHYDHLDRHTVRWLAEHHSTTTWFAPLGVARLVRRWGASDVRELDWWQSDVVGDASVSCVPARHFSSRTLWDRDRTLWAGWTIVADGWRVFFAGDTAYHPEFGRIAREHGPFDLVILPVGAYEPRWFMGGVHMNPDDAMMAYNDLRSAQPAAPPPAMLPIHWGTFRLTDEPMDEPPARTRARWAEARLSSELLWLPTHGQTQRRERTG
ncbi:MAG TPA: MBL fold metallo-hydrolase [Gemmatimonadaceae bacterium]